MAGHASPGYRQAVWVVVAFLGIFAFQRIAVPGLPISVTVPLTLVWAALAVYYGVLELDSRRLVVWLVASGFSGMLMVAQALFVLFPLISVNSWLLWIITWLPMVFRFRDRTQDAHQTTMRGIAWSGAALSALSILFILLQLVGVGYRDLLAQYVPSSLLVQNFVITYPIAWGSPIYKANAWLALEPSFLSFMLGVALVAALISRRHPMLVLWIGLGLLCTTAGSGIAVVVVYLLVALLRGRATHLGRYLVIAIPLAVIAAATALGDAILDRVGEVGEARSSTALRMVEPYQHLVPKWLAEPALFLLGGGPGSSQRVVEDLGINGLLVPTPAKLLYDYGIVGGLLMLAMILVAYLGSPAPELAVALAVSMLTLQGAAQPLVALTLLTVTLFAPVQTIGVPTPPTLRRETSLVSRDPAMVP